MIIIRFLVFHLFFVVLLFFVFFLIQKSYPDIIPQNNGIVGIVFMSVIHIGAGLYIMTLKDENPKKRIFKAIVIHSVKFIFSLFFVLSMLLIAKDDNYGLGIMLASLFFLYMLVEIGMFAYAQKQLGSKPDDK